MKAIVENLELRKNNFSKWFSGVFALLSLFAFLLLSEPMILKYGGQQQEW
jgi:hypothetical protein